MRFPVRLSLLAVLAGVLLALSAPAAQAAFGIESFFAANCKEGHETCKKPAKPSEEKEKAEEEGFTQAAGHPPFGVTDFTVSTHVIQTVPFEAVAPDGLVTHVRTDVAPGVSTNPEAVAKCTAEEFGDKELAPGTGAFPEPTCPGGSIIGVNKVVVLVEAAKGVFANVPLEGTVYNLVQPNGLASEFGVALSLEPLGKPGIFAHTLIEGHVEWASDYHDYFEINVSPVLPLISSRLVFKGNIGTGGFLTNPTSCTGIGPQTTSKLTLKSAEGEVASQSYTTPIGTDGCNAVPFAPTFSLASGLGAEMGSDKPDGITTEVGLPHDPNPSHLDSSQLKEATIILPEGMTLNPSAAAGLEACTPKQARIHSLTPGTECPSGSKLGTATLEVPGLPAGSLTGNVYLGGPESGPITGFPTPMYVVAESERYGISVRIKGTVTPNEATGRVTASFVENPEQPFTNLTLHMKGGALAPIANPLVCGTATALTTFTPFTGTAAQMPMSSFTVDNGAGGSCANPLPFSPSQSTTNQAPGNAGANTSFALNFERPEGNQYLAQVKTVMPPGLVGKIPAVTLCPEPQANSSTLECPAASQIGSVIVTSGSGPTPFALKGNVYMTGPYNGAPYGLKIAVPVNAGPFSLGNDVVRSTINIDPVTGQVIATSNVPTIFRGIPTRLRAIHLEINKQGFLVNPTNCGVLATASTLTSSFGATAPLSSPFQVNNCNALPFKPTFAASTSAKTSKANGASLTTTITQPAGQANIKSVMVQLPKQLPSRLSTLQKSCLEKTFANNPAECPVTSKVGGATVVTPVLPDKLTGSAYLVSHGGQAFPDLDLVLSADGVKVILTGNTAIKKGITTTTFASTPDVPVSSVSVNLPVGSHSALTANGNLCASKLVMPTTITAQNGATLKQNTTISVSNCGVRVAGHKTVGKTAYLTVQTYSPGRISGKGKNVATVFRKLSKAQKSASLKVSLSHAGQSKRKPLKVKIRVGFVPNKKGTPSSVSYVTVVYR